MSAEFEAVTKPGMLAPDAIDLAGINTINLEDFTTGRGPAASKPRKPGSGIFSPHGIPVLIQAAPSPEPAVGRTNQATTATGITTLSGINMPGTKATTKASAMTVVAPVAITPEKAGSIGTVTAKVLFASPTDRMGCPK